MNVVGFCSEQVGMNRSDQVAALSEIEANCRLCRCGRDVDRLCTTLDRYIDRSVPESVRCTSSAVGPRDVEEGQPSQFRFKGRLHYREPDCPLLFECAEKYATTRNNRRAELDQGRDAVRTRPCRVPPRNLGHRSGNLLQLPVDHAVLDIDMLGSVDPSHKRNVLGTQPSHPQHLHRLPLSVVHSACRRTQRSPATRPLSIETRQRR